MAANFGGATLDQHEQRAHDPNSNLLDAKLDPVFKFLMGEDPKRMAWLLQSCIPPDFDWKDDDLPNIQPRNTEVALGQPDHHHGYVDVAGYTKNYRYIIEMQTGQESFETHVRRSQFYLGLTYGTQPGSVAKRKTFPVKVLLLSIKARGKTSNSERVHTHSMRDEITDACIFSGMKIVVVDLSKPTPSGASTLYDEWLDMRAEWYTLFNTAHTLTQAPPNTSEKMLPLWVDLRTASSTLEFRRHAYRVEQEEIEAKEERQEERIMTSNNWKDGLGNFLTKKLHDKRIGKDEKAFLNDLQQVINRLHEKSIGTPQATNADQHSLEPQTSTSSASVSFGLRTHAYQVEQEQIEGQQERRAGRVETSDDWYNALGNFMTKELQNESIGDKERALVERFRQAIQRQYDKSTSEATDEPQASTSAATASSSTVPAAKR